MEKTIPEVFFKTAEKSFGKTALLYKKGGVYFPITYRELSEKIKNLSYNLQNLGLKKDDKIAILSENRPEWVISDIAIMLMGGVVVPLHTTFGPEAICKILNHSQTKIIIVSNSNLLNKILLNYSKLKYLKKIIFLEKLTVIQKKNLKNKIISWKKISSIINSGNFKKISLHPENPCTIIYTSGTTGDPKGVVLTHRNFLSNIEAVNKSIPVKESDIFLSFLPISHVLERTGGYYIPLFFGATIAYTENIKQLPNNLKEVMPTALISVPRIFEKFHDAIWDKVNASSIIKKKLFLWALKQKRNTFLYKIADLLVFKKIRTQLGGKLRLAISGGASLNENICKFFYKIGILILEGYGLTETSPIVTVNQEKNFKFGTVGKAIGGVEIKISLQKEILVKGPNVFMGYFKNKKAGESCFNNGWFCTGDLGFIDSQGFLTIIGRKKEMILLSNGKNVWPEPIENLLNNDKFISQSVVIGNKQKFISALIIPDWQEVKIFLKKNKILLQSHEKLVKNPLILSLFQDRLDQKINPKLSDFEKIKKFGLLPSEFSQENEELTPTLKLRRHIIERKYKKETQSLYS